MNGTYGSYIYEAEALRVIDAHDASQPLFIYMALQVMHAPQEVPKPFSDKYPSPKYDVDYAIMNGMASMADEVLTNVTTALQHKGMWADTLLVYSSDNGGPAGKLASGPCRGAFTMRAQFPHDRLSPSRLRPQRQQLPASWWQN
jgi:arylsulfatase A-like enzyme